jgi:hypothetical protein
LFYTIYKITNQINGNYYIGKHQTRNLDDGYMGSGKLLKLAIAKYGVDNFKKEILHIFNSEADMNAKEKELVVVSESTYNLIEGGHGGFGYINRTMDLKQRNIEINSRRNYKDPSFRLRLSEGVKRSLPTRKTATYSEESRRRSLAPFQKGNTAESIEKKKQTWKLTGRGKGEKNSQYGTCWITNGVENKKIQKTDLENYLAQGYIKGRKMQSSK